MERRDSIEIPDAFERLNLFRNSNKSAVWKHFGFIERGGNFVKCIHCETTLKYNSNTTNFRTHLRNRHRHIFDCMVASENNARSAAGGQNSIEQAVGTIVYEILPSRLEYTSENAEVSDNEKEASGNETAVAIEGINSDRTVSQECIPAASVSYEKADHDAAEISHGEAYSLREERFNRKRKNTAVDLATIAKLMKDFLDYQKESDQLFLEMERQWQEREERLRKEDREHSLYMLKLLLAKKQDK